MSKQAFHQADDRLSNVEVSNDAPDVQVQDESYLALGREPIPVQKDDAPVEDPIDAKTADSDEQLERDEKESIDKSNIIKDKTRHANPIGSYKEPK
jgi:hypothetical protein